MSTQSVIDQAVNIATRAALAGHPIERVIWIQPQTSTQREDGFFAVQYYGGLATASITPPWEKS